VPASGEEQRAAGGEHRAAATDRAVARRERSFSLDAHEPGEPGDRQEARDVEVEAQTENAVRRVDAEELLEDPEARVAGDVEREQAWCADSPASPERDQHAGERHVEDQFVEERRLEGGIALIAHRPVGWVNLKPPREAGRSAKQLLVEVVPDPSDCLGDEQAGSDGIHESGDVGARAAQPPRSDERAGGDPAPDPQASLPDRERPPPVVGNLVPARREVVQPSPYESRREPPHRDVVHQLPPPSALLPAPHRENDGGADPEHIHQPIRVKEQRPDVKAITRRTRYERGAH
jgi:hypothetical protein